MKELCLLGLQFNNQKIINFFKDLSNKEYKQNKPQKIFRNSTQEISDIIVSKDRVIYLSHLPNTEDIYNISSFYEVNILMHYQDLTRNLYGLYKFENNQVFLKFLSEEDFQNINYDRDDIEFYKVISEILNDQKWQEIFILKELTNYGDRMSIEEFIEAVEDGYFIDYDGYGYYIKDEKLTQLFVRPSDLAKGKVRKDFKEIMWYNR